MSKEQQLDYITNLGAKYDELKTEIDVKIDEIKNDVLRCNPIQLLQCSSDMFKMQNRIALLPEEISDNSDESDVFTENKPYMATEYIQSIYASSPVNPSMFSDNEDKSTLYFKIISDIDELIDLIHTFYFSWGALAEKKYPEMNNEDHKLLFEEQLFFLVRGKRFQVFEKEIHEKLLNPHNDAFIDIFGVSSNDIVEGLIKLQYALSQQKLDLFIQCGDLIDKIEASGLPPEQLQENDKSQIGDILARLFGTELYDVQEITKWPDKLIDELSWEQGDCPCFWDGEFGGWPIIDMPIAKRPFIKINGKSYCFDYYSLMDNFYRCIQKATTRVRNDYQWSSVQQNASEKMVAGIFEDLLPGCKTYTSNYYPINQSLKQMAENDLIVIYDNTLIIVEVKAGSFVYTSPITDFSSHIASYKKLIEEADIQCKRTKDYLLRSDISKLYNHDKSEKANIKMSDVVSIFMLSVTVDNINELAARAEKVKFLKLQAGAISISIDDLFVYREYFDSPLVFLHFLKHRQLATINPKIALNDELDHLGMYISHNYYCFQTNGYEENTVFFFAGYREDLHRYYESLVHPELSIQKPVQNLPSLFKQIIDYLLENDVVGRSEIANYFLDFSSDARNLFCEQVSYVMKRQKEKHITIPVSTVGNSDSLRYTLFINQPPYVKSLNFQTEYALATLSWNKESDRTLIILSFKFDKLTNVKFMSLSPNDINDENRERIVKLGEENAKRRLLEYQLKNPGKIGRNIPCPCGSGKKYKHCCGRSV